LESKKEMTATCSKKIKNAQKKERGGHDTERQKKTGRENQGDKNTNGGKGRRRRVRKFSEFKKKKRLSQAGVANPDGRMPTKTNHRGKREELGGDETTARPQGVGLEMG